jgi:hypothetical protein
VLKGADFHRSPRNDDDRDSNNKQAEGKKSAKVKMPMAIRIAVRLITDTSG